MAEVGYHRNCSENVKQKHVFDKVLLCLAVLGIGFAY